jgi:hypothetical protein
MNLSLQADKTVTISDFISPVPHCHKGGDRIQPFILFFIDEAEVLSGFPPTRE